MLSNVYVYPPVLGKSAGSLVTSKKLLFFENVTVPKTLKYGAK
jgi:hypothetical protein